MVQIPASADGWSQEQETRASRALATRAASVEAERGVDELAP